MFSSSRLDLLMEGRNSKKEGNSKKERERGAWPEGQLSVLWVWAWIGHQIKTQPYAISKSKIFFKWKCSWGSGVGGGKREYAGINSEGKIK